jgi:hypothetical protein
MTVLRDAIIDRIDFHIEMHMDSINSLVGNIEADDDDDVIEATSWEMKKVRNLKQLKKTLTEGNMPSCGSPQGYTLREILDMMMELDF